MIALTHGNLESDEIVRTTDGEVTREDIGTMLTSICESSLKYRTRAAAVLSYHRGIRVSHIAHFFGVSHAAVDSWIWRFAQQGCQSLVNAFSSQYRKIEDKEYEDAVFRILHSPPSTHGSIAQAGGSRTFKRSWLNKEYR